MDTILPYKKLIAAGSLALGGLLVFIASFMKFLIMKADGETEKYNLKKISEMAGDIDETKFNPHALFIIFAILGIVAAAGIFIGNNFMVGLDKICLFAGAAIGIIIFIIVLVYGSSGALGDVKDYMDSMKALIYAFSEESVKVSNGPGYVLTIIGSLIMILGSGFAIVLDFIAPSGNQTQYPQA